MKRYTLSERALILAPRGRDASIASAILKEAGFAAEPCGSLGEMLRELDAGAAFVVVTEESLATANLGPLAQWLSDQEEWSDLPLVLLTSAGGGLERNPAAQRYLNILGNVSLLERPFHPTTLVSLARSALRSRIKQYEARARLAALAEGEMRFRNMADHAPVMTWVTDPSGYCTYLNRRWYEFTGQTKEQAEGFGWLEAVHPDDRGWSGETFLTANAKREAFRLEYRLRRHDGEYRWAIDAASPRHSPSGEYLGYVGSVFDIHDRRETEARSSALAELGDAIRNLHDPSEIGFVAAATLGRALGVSRVSYAAIDPDAETLHVDRDWTAQGVDSLAGVLSLKDCGAFIDNLKRGEFIAISDVRIDPRTAGPASGAFETKSARSIVSVPVVERGRLVAVFFVNHDEARQWAEGELTLIRDFAERTRTAIERARGEEALRDSEARYRTLFENIDAGFCVVEMIFDESGRPIDYRFVETNPAFERQSGIKNALGRRVREFLPEQEKHWFEIFGDISKTGKPARFESSSDTLERWFDIYAVRAGNPEQRRVAILFNNITERKQAEERLRELNETLESQVADRAAERDRLWNLSQDMLARADYSGMISAVSPAWKQVLGWNESELLSRPYATFMHPDDAPPTLDAISRMAAARLPARFENRIANREGGWKSIEWTVTPEPNGVNFIAVGRDLTLTKAREAELEIAQEALRQSQKMEAMGQLTGGVAHDFNNLLTPIVGVLDMLQRKGLGGEREQRLIDGAAQSAERAKILVQRLLAFARRQPLQPLAVDIAKLMENMAALVSSTTGPQIKVVVDIADATPPAKADPNQLEMALLNLAVNARDAMPEGGTLRISASADVIPPGANPKLRPGRYVRLSVADTGLGMDEATLARAVEPFFSTKGVGKGTGLGLSMVHGLASQLGGALTIQSRPSLGTNIELWLPQAEATPDAPPIAADPDMAPGRGTALLVDDEQLVRLSTSDMLGDLGYHVVEAASAEEALRLIGNGARPDVVVTDHLMPGISGTELARAIRDLLPNTPVLIVSGYAEVDGVANDLPRLTKPFRKDELAAGLSALRASQTA